MKTPDFKTASTWNRREFLGASLASTAALAAPAAHAAEIKTAANTAGGEQDNDLAQWRRMIRMNAVDIVQPDVLYVGGITRAWRVAQMAHAAGKKVVPHTANHSLVMLFTLHLCSALPNLGPFVEWSVENGGLDTRAAEILSPGPFIKDGRVHCEAGPGWGVKINPDWLKSATYQKSERGK